MKLKLAPVLLLLALPMVGFWWLTRPVPLPQLDAAAQPLDLDNGRTLFHAGGCASCHGALNDGKPQGELLAGGLEMHTPAGIFRVPNISPDPQAGIGAWSDAEFLRAMRSGVSPAGKHYYPAFPYTAYARMSPSDILDLKGYLDTLPPSAEPSRPHDLRLPARWRRGVGLWKRMYLDNDWVIAVDLADEQLVRGRYLVEGPGHCAECHTPRTRTLALDTGRWLQGAANAEGTGRNPDISPGKKGLSDWSVDDIEYYLEAGVDPDFDVVGGDMVAVQENMARLSAADRKAIAAYLKAVPPSP